jgi:diguanylate cyclase (GGDEF)-like protein
MTVLSLTAWAFGRRLGTLPPSSTRDRGAQLAQLRRLLGWATPAFAAFATLAAAAGAAYRDRPTVFGALALIATVAMVPLLLRALATPILVRLDAAITERETLQAELDAAHKAKEEFRELAYHDDLTGLPNRGLLYDRLGLAITQSHRQASHLALLFLDLDDFKTVNDSFGHGSGDRLLVELATRVRGCVRAGDTVARFGGDEFIVLLDSVTGPEDAARVAAKVLDAVRAPFRLDGHEVAIVASVGVSVYPRDGTSPDDLVRSADAAMYRDKQREAPPLHRQGEGPVAKDDEIRGVR